MGIYNNTPTFTWVKLDGILITHNNIIYTVEDIKTNLANLYWELDNPYKLKATDFELQTSSTRFIILRNNKGEGILVPNDNISVSFDGNSLKMAEENVIGLVEKTDEHTNKFLNVEQDINGIKQSVGTWSIEGGTISENIAAIKETSTSIDLSVKELDKKYDENNSSNELVENINKSIIDYNSELRIFSGSLLDYFKDNSVSNEEKISIDDTLALLDSKSLEISKYVDDTISLAETKGELVKKDSIIIVKNDFITSVSNLKNYVIDAISDNVFTTTDISGIVNLISVCNVKVYSLKNTVDDFIFLGAGGKISEELARIGIKSNEISLKADTTIVDGLENRVSSAEEKITPYSITQTVQSERSSRIYRVRYIRDWQKGSDSDSKNTWSEIQVLNNKGVNIAKGKTSFTGINGDLLYPIETISKLTDEVIDTSFIQVGDNGTLSWLQLDLGQIYEDIDSIVIHHYYADERVCYETKTEVSDDGINWIKLFDSSTEGTYQETKNGHSIRVNLNSYSRTGISKFDDDGLTIKHSDSDTYTKIDSGAFSVNDNKGGTVAEFGRNSIIPNITSGGVMFGNMIYANNVPTKSLSNNNTRIIHVDGAIGSDKNTGSDTSRLKTIQHALDYMVEDLLNENVTIYIHNSVNGFTLNGRSGSGAITFYFQDSAIISGQVFLNGVQNRLFITNLSGKATFKNGILIHGCRNVELYGLVFRGVNIDDTNVSIKGTSYCSISSCDLGGLADILQCSIKVESSLLWTHNLRGSNIQDVIRQNSYSMCNIAKTGTITVPDYTGGYHVGYDPEGRYQNMTGANIVKTGTSGWNPIYTPSSITTTWAFNKIWSLENLINFEEKQELIQGYSTFFAEGSYTGYIQMQDSMQSIRDTISGGYNLSGRISVQRRVTSGLPTGSTLHLYASDSTHYMATINQGQEVWINLDSAMITKIMNGTVTFFYLMADADDKTTYFKCESNSKIEITYTK